MADRYMVVVNHEEQYTLVPVDRAIPRGWSKVGKVGGREECLDYIEEVWTDNRPGDLCRAVSELERRLPLR